MWCHDKLTHWLPDSDIIELTDKFQLVNNFTVYETSSQLSIRSLIPKHFCHIISSCIQAHAEQWNSSSTRLSFREISVFYFVSLVPKLSISQTENSLSSLYKGLWGSCCQQINSQNWELAVCFWTTVKPEFQRLVSNHQTGLNICNVLICWLSLSLWLTWMHLLAGSYQVTYQVQLHPSLVVLK